MSRRPTEATEARAAARIAAARQAVAIAAKRAAEEQSRFAATVHAASASPGVRSGVPCELAMPEATHVMHGRRTFPLLIVAEGDRRLPSPSVASVLADVRRAEDHFDSGRFVDGILYANALDVSARLLYDVVLVTSVFKPPIRTSASTFEPGAISGRAYVYDFRAHRVTCAGDVNATSSGQVEYSYVPDPLAFAALDPRASSPRDQASSLTASLDADLEFRVRRAIAEGSLFALDP